MIKNKFLLHFVHRVNVPIIADRKSRRLSKIKKMFRLKSRDEFISKTVFGIDQVECNP